MATGRTREERLERFQQQRIQSLVEKDQSKSSDAPKKSKKRKAEELGDSKETKQEEKSQPKKLEDYMKGTTTGYPQIENTVYSPALDQILWKTQNNNNLLTNINSRLIHNVDKRRKDVNKRRKVERGTKKIRPGNHDFDFRKELKEYGLHIRGKKDDEHAYLIQEAKIAEQKPFFTNRNDFWKLYFSPNAQPSAEEIAEFIKNHSLSGADDRKAYKTYQEIIYAKGDRVGASVVPKKKDRKKDCSDDESEIEFSDHESDFIYFKTDTKKMDTSSNNSNSSNNSPTSMTDGEKKAEAQQEPVKKTKQRVQKPKAKPKKTRAKQEVQPTADLEASAMDTSSANGELVAEPALQIPVGEAPIHPMAPVAMEVQTAAPVQALQISQTSIEALVPTAAETQPPNGNGRRSATAAINLALSAGKSRIKSHKKTTPKPKPDTNRMSDEDSEAVPMQVVQKANSPAQRQSFGSTLFTCHPDEFLKRMFIRDIVGTENQCKRIVELAGCKYYQCFDAGDAAAKQKTFQQKADSYQLGISFVQKGDKLLLLSKNDSNEQSSSVAAVEKLKQLNAEGNAVDRAEAERSKIENQERMNNLFNFGVRR